ncbi:MAG: adenosine deaminase [Actinomycetes bacterium]
MSLDRKPTSEELKRAPKALLHDHLDGGLRPQTILDLAKESGYAKLPAADADSLAKWFADAADSGSLEKYLETFAHTVGVMQSPSAIARVAREAALDLAEDGVAYAEIRFAPELHLADGMEMRDVVEAVLVGFAQGEADARDLGKIIKVRTLLTAIRNLDAANETAQLVVEYRDRGVVGFDIAGAEAGYPPTLQLDAFEYLRRENAHFTIHAGEAFGLPSIWEAIQICGAERLGHGVRIMDDITFVDGVAHLGKLASYVRDRRIPLELCPSSNLQTGAVMSIADHPIGKLAKLRFRVTVNTDNRLMSKTSMTHEFTELSKAFDWSLLDYQRVTVNALKSAFIPFEERLEIIEKVVKPAYLAL